MNFELSQLKNIFSHIYGSSDEVYTVQINRYSKLIEKFKTIYSAKDFSLFSTPGRTEIGGNHTDHNFGRVLAGSVNLDSIAVAAPNNSKMVNMYSEGYPEPFIVDLANLSIHKKETETTSALIRGIAAKFDELGYAIGGFNSCITSDVLPGSGLSSSASIEVLIGTIFNKLYNENKIAPEEIALIGQYAENHYFGKPCGLMDQMTCAVGGIITIDFKKPHNPVVKKVDFDFSAQEYRLMVVDTGGNHADLTEDYAAVPNEMKSVAKALGAKVCRDLEADELIHQILDIREKVGDRAILRALHFLGDNERVVDQVAALEAGDFKKFLHLVNESGDSSFKKLQNIYSPKNVREQGISLALALTENYLTKIGEGACRVHGGGFAGTIQVFLPNISIKPYKEMMTSVFGLKSVLTLSIRPFGSIHLNDYL